MLVFEGVVKHVKKPPSPLEGNFLKKKHVGLQKSQNTSTQGLILEFRRESETFQS